MTTIVWGTCNFNYNNNTPKLVGKSINEIKDLLEIVLSPMDVIVTDKNGIRKEVDHGRYTLKDGDNIEFVYPNGIKCSVVRCQVCGENKCVTERADCLKCGCKS